MNTFKSRAALSVTLLYLASCGQTLQANSQKIEARDNGAADEAKETVFVPPEVTTAEKEQFNAYEGGYFDLRWGEDYVGDPVENEGVESFQMAFIIQPGLLYQIYGNASSGQPASSSAAANSQTRVMGGPGVGSTQSVNSISASQTTKQVSLCINIIESGGNDAKVVQNVKQRAEKGLRGWIAIAEAHAWASQNYKGVRGVTVGDKPGCKPVTIVLHHSYSKSSSVCKNGRACATSGGSVYLPNNAYSTSEMTITHELGHVLGLGDTYEEAGYIQLNKKQPPSVMNAKTSTFSDDDKTGVLLIMDALQNGQKVPPCGRGYKQDYSGIENKNNNRYCLPTEGAAQSSQSQPQPQTQPRSSPSRPVSTAPNAAVQPQPLPAAPRPAGGGAGVPSGGGCGVGGAGLGMVCR